MCSSSACVIERKGLEHVEINLVDFHGIQCGH